MVRLVVYGMCDFWELLIRFEWSYQSAILAIYAAMKLQLKEADTS